MSRAAIGRIRYLTPVHGAGDLDWVPARRTHASVVQWSYGRDVPLDAKDPTLAGTEDSRKPAGARNCGPNS